MEFEEVLFTDSKKWNLADDKAIEVVVEANEVNLKIPFVKRNRKPRNDPFVISKEGDAVWTFGNEKDFSQKERISIGNFIMQNFKE